MTLMHASVWFGHPVDRDSKVLLFMIYFEGSPGWHDQPSDFEWQIHADPATIDMSVGNTEISAKYWQSRSEVELFGSKFNLAVHNTLLVSEIDSPRPLVRGLGVYDLSFVSDDNPATALLERSPELRFALSGIREPKRQQDKSVVSWEVLSWVQEGLGLIRAGNHKDDVKACELFRRAALTGYAAFQYQLGLCYESGRGVEQEYSTANEWFEKAAKQGHVDAQYKMGHSYRVGRGIEIDFGEALRWYKMAADNGDLEALHNVGWMYITNRGVDVDHEEAFTWLLRAAKKGDLASQYEVARRLRVGGSVGSDLTECYAWLIVLQAQRKMFAPTDWNRVQELINVVEPQLNPKIRTEAGRLSRERLREIARQKILGFGM